MARLYELATEADDALLRALLADNPMQGWVQLCLTREPSYFAGIPPIGRHRVVIGRENESVIGMYTCSEQNLHMNGAVQEVGYLGGLRIKNVHRHRYRVLREGTAAISRFSMPDTRLWYTTITSDNRIARRLLEAHLPGLPVYRPLNELVTLVLPTSRGIRRALWQPAWDSTALCMQHNEMARQWQFSPVLKPDDLEKLTCAGARFFQCRNAVMAIWPRPYQQVLVQGYRWPLNWLRVPHNFFATLSRRLLLPTPGRPMQYAFLAFLAAPSDMPETVSLIEDALWLGRTQKQTALTLALHANHPALPRLINHFHPIQYRTWVYTATFPELPHPEPDGRPAQPEAALL